MTDWAEKVFRGDVVTSSRIIRDGFVACVGGRVVAVGTGAPPPSADVFDWRGKYIFPGIVDGHMHTSIQGWAGIAGATRSAAAGGITTVIDMPYDTPNAVTNAEVLATKLGHVEQSAHVDMALYGTVSTKVNADDIAALAEGGISAFKLSTYEVSADRFPRFGPPLFLAAFREIAKTGLPVAIHNEDQELVNDLVAKAIAAGRTDAIMHCRTRPPLSETLANLEVFELGLETGAHVHIAHSSVARGFDMAEWYREQGGDATAETCLHYLAMTEDDVVRLKGFAKCNPPLRSQAEVEAVWDRVIAGKAAYVSSDHAPWQPARKGSPNIFDNASGLTGLQSFAPIMFSMLHERGLPLTMLALLCSERSARFHGLYPRKGAIEPGADCDLMAMEPGEFTFDESVIVDEEHFRWSPFNGRPVKARVAGTVLRGRIVFDGKTVHAKPGVGQFVNRRKVAAQALEQKA